MRRTTKRILLGVGLALFAGSSSTGLLGSFFDPLVCADEEVLQPAATTENAPATIAEARGRARLLHEALHGTLQVVHRDFFLEDESVTIPSRSFEDVFHELERSFQVQVRWLIVNADTLNIDHLPQDEFERNAVKELAAGKTEFDALEKEIYRYAGSIRLSSQCLKCHVAKRTNTNPRAAGLLISMPVKQQEAR